MNTIYRSKIDLHYDCKRLLCDSVDRTRRGFRLLIEGEFLSGTGHLLLARVEAVAAVAIAFLASIGGGGLAYMLGTPFFLISATGLNLFSRLPFINSFDRVKTFRHESEKLISGVRKVYACALPIFFLYLTSCTVNVIAPGLLGNENLLFRAMNDYAEPLGPLRTIYVRLPGRGRYQGVPDDPGKQFLEPLTELVRAYVPQNRIQEIKLHEFSYHGDVIKCTRSFVGQIIPHRPEDERYYCQRCGELR